MEFDGSFKMRFLDVILICVILALSSSVFSKQIFSLKKLNDAESQLRACETCLKFVSRSFCNSCKGKGFASLEEWQKVCAAMWKLENINWDVQKDNLLHGCWSGPYGSGEVYCHKMN